MMRLILVFVFSAGSFGIFSGQAASLKPGEQPLSITISGPESDVPAGASVPVKVRLTNTSSHDVNGLSTYNQVGVDITYQYDVRRDSGEPMRPIRTRHGGAETSSGIMRTLKQGESAEETTDIAGLYDLGPGKYTIQLSRRVSLNPQEGVVKSNTIKITVVPPPFSIEISTPTPEVKAGSPIALNIRLTNPSSHDAVLSAPPPRGAVDPHYGYACFNRMGGQNTAGSALLNMGNAPFATLKPGEVRDEQVPISSACDLSHPGEYRIRLSRPDPNDPQHRPVTSNEITVKVEPKI